MTICLPLWAVSDIEQKTLDPIAIIVMMTLVATTSLSVNFVPAAVAFFFNKKVAEHNNSLIGKAKDISLQFLTCGFFNGLAQPVDHAGLCRL